MLREGVKPVKHPSIPGYGVNHSMAYSGAILKFKTNEIRAVYKNNSRDPRWTLWKNTEGTNGGAYCDVSESNYDPSATYSATYIKLDKSPIVPVTGAVAANEKAQLSDLTAGVAEALHGVSVLTQKKADKDAPGWITPTLLNGATQFGDVTFGLVGYRKVGNYIEFRGLIVPTVALGVVFILPPEYRPAYSYIVACRAATSGVADVRVHKGGEVTIGNVDTWVSLWNIRVPLN
ncbi:hypothetical protein D1872_238140 [compost metagenome]